MSNSHLGWSFQTARSFGTAMANLRLKGRSVMRCWGSSPKVPHGHFFRTLYIIQYIYIIIIYIYIIYIYICVSRIKFKTKKLFTVCGAFLNSPCYKFWPKLAGEFDSQKTPTARYHSWKSQHDNNPSIHGPRVRSNYGKSKKLGLDYPNKTISSKNRGSRTLVTRCSLANIWGKLMEIPGW